MKVSIDKSKCAVCRSCVAICPEVFEMRDDGVVDVKPEYQGVEITDPQIQEKVRQAFDACPAMAIVIEE
jgi:ferredoxin